MSGERKPKRDWHTILVTDEVKKKLDMMKDELRRSGMKPSYNTVIALLLKERGEKDA